MNPIKFILAALRSAGVFGLHLDSGGGGQQQAASQTQVADLPEWAKPYAKETLGKAQALTQTPYQAYGGERIAVRLGRYSGERGGFVAPDPGRSALVARGAGGVEELLEEREGRIRQHVS